MRLIAALLIPTSAPASSAIVVTAVLLAAVSVLVARRRGRRAPGSTRGHTRSLGSIIRPWAAAGVSVHDVAEFEAAFGPAPKGVDLLQQWMTVLRSTSSEALEWRRLPGNDSPSGAALWRNTGFDAASASDWVRERWSPADAWLWSSRGRVSCRDATEWIAAGGGSLPPMVLARWSLPEFAGNMASAYAWQVQGATPIEARIWQVTFGDHAVAAPWRAAKFDPHTAKRWSEVGLGVSDAAGMAERGLRPDDVAGWGPWLDDPDSIRQWQRAGAAVLGVAQDFIDHGFKPDSARPWLALGMSGSASRQWIDLGFEADDASVWKPHMAPALARSWRLTNLAPEKAVRWSSEGFSPSEARRWIGAGFTDPSVAHALRRGGCELADARAWVAAGVEAASILLVRKDWTVDAYRAWADIGFADLAVAAQWRAAGFEPAAAREWQGHGVTPAFAVVLLSAGLTVSDSDAVATICAEEGVDAAEAVWRHSIVQSGFNRRGGVPVHDPEHGRGRRDELVRFVRAAIASRCADALVLHDAPFLTRAMSDALPEARPVRGATKHWIWCMESELEGLLEVADADERHLRLICRGAAARRATFGETVGS